MEKTAKSSRQSGQSLPYKADGNNDERFLDIASELRQTLEEAPDEFLATAKRLGVDRRKAYYLVEIDRSLDRLEADRQRLARIGWTKLQILSGKLSLQNVESLLTLAEKHPAHKLAELVRDARVDPDARKRAVLLYLDETEYDLFRRVVVAHGAVVSGKRIAGKERALVAALRKLET